MTRLLERAFKDASRLPDIEQNVLAKWLLEELEAERKWDRAFAGSEDILGQLADPQNLCLFIRNAYYPLLQRNYEH